MTGAGVRTQAGDTPHSSTWVAGLGGVIGGFIVYIVLSGMGGGVDLEDRLTFDQSGELELEGLGIIAGIVLAVAVGVPVGTWIALRWARSSAAGKTALLTLIPIALVTALAIRLIPSDPGSLVLAPYAVFASWFWIPFLTRWAVEAAR